MRRYKIILKKSKENEILGNKRKKDEKKRK